MKRLFFLLCASLLFFSCVKDMDPFEGGDGIRASFNGVKCVMYGLPGESVGASYSEGNTFTFDTGEVLMAARTTGKRLRFRLTVSDDAALAPGRQYAVGSQGMTAGVKFVTDDAIGHEIPLKGWVTFLQVGPQASTTEARFELTGETLSEGKLEFRHGFLRLYTRGGGGQ